MKGQGLLVLAACALAPAAQAYSRGYVRQPTPGGLTMQMIDQRTLDVVGAPAAVDWSALGALTPVKDQGQCGGCWAFSTTEGVESAVFRSTGKLPPLLSTEQLIDCEKRDLGCNGGDIPEAVRWLMKEGMTTNAEYPDDSSKRGKNKKCTWTKNKAPPVVRVESFKYAVKQCQNGNCADGDEAALAAAVAQYGPLSICINSGDKQPGDWNKYKGGVLTKECKPKANLIDHCVQLVGYNKTASPPFWKIRNSWGKSWGEEGFIRIAYGKENACCVTCEAVAINATLGGPDY